MTAEAGGGSEAEAWPLPPVDLCGVSAGDACTLAYARDGRVYGWGDGQPAPGRQTEWPCEFESVRVHVGGGCDEFARPRRGARGGSAAEHEDARYEC